MESQNVKNVSRRNFLANSAIGMVAGAMVPAMVTGCSSSTEPQWKPIDFPEWPDKAPDGKPLKAALIGCGGRGSGAIVNFLDAGNGLSVVALADVFPDRLNSCRSMLKGKGHEIPDDKCFLGFDAYKQAIATDADVVLLCTPPVFRAEHFTAAVDAGKHIFMEKPCAVDPTGARAILVAAKRAEQKGLCVISGTIRRSQKDCIETWRRVQGGAIGDFVSAHVIRNGGALWHKKREEGWTDMEYMLRNWVNFCWLSGDHIVEQFIHEIDQMTWFVGQHPVRANAYGGRHRRVNGDQFDFFCVEYEYADKKRSNCSARQINGCSNEHAILVYGTKGYTNCFNKIWDLSGNIVWEYPYPKEGDTDKSWVVKDPFEMEHVRLVTAIRTNQPVNDAEAHVQSTLMTIMARQSAYTGKDVTWDEITASALKLGPETYAFGPVPGIPEIPPVPGTL
ncbi:MAG: Gfo/Idh/MocA family oxidoreductase [Bacteroidales bacterium]|nr:Gfo/Idh/MocA family oxidoreductase [Bacteroidales bacterium]